MTPSPSSSMPPSIERPVRDDDYDLLMAVVGVYSPIRHGPAASFEERLLAQLLQRTKEPNAMISVELAQALRRLVLRSAAELPRELVVLAQRTMHESPARQVA